MAQLTKANTVTKYNDSGSGLFKDNTSGDIGADDARALVTDVTDSVPFTADDSYTWPFPQVTASGTDTYAATTSPAISAYATGQKFQIKFTNASTGVSTLNLNTLGAKKIYTNPTTQATTGDITAAQIYLLIYDAALDAAAGGFLMIGGGGAVDSVNGQTGVVVLDAGDVGADPAGSASTVATNLSNHISDTSDAHDASAISFAATGNIAATDVQAAIAELDTEKQSLINSATALTDASSMDLTAIKHTLTTSSSTRTFTISYTGDDISLKVILNTTDSVFTFPAGALCVNSDGSASGDNTCTLEGASGDVYVFAIKHWGSAVYTVVCKNTLQ